MNLVMLDGFIKNYSGYSEKLRMDILYGLGIILFAFLVREI